MCYYDMLVYACNDWRWDKFRERCHSEYRIGETCGRKLVKSSIATSRYCKCCEKIQAKQRRRAAEVERVTRWQREGGKFKASIEKSVATIHELDAEIMQLNSQRQTNRYQINQRAY